MDLLNVVFGVITLLSFGLALWQYHVSKVNSNTEYDKAKLSEQRINQAHNTLHSILYNLDMMVQTAKNPPEQGIQTLQMLAKAVRSQAYVLKEELQSEMTHLNKWRYGEIISLETDPIDAELTIQLEKKLNADK